MFVLVIKLEMVWEDESPVYIDEIEMQISFEKSLLFAG